MNAHNPASFALADHETIRQLYIRICRDSGFTLPYERAAALTGAIVGIPALLVWPAFPGIDDMQRIAGGTHPALDLPRYQTVKA